MAIHGMNHFNVLTDKLEQSRAFYTKVLGFTDGPRPPLTFGGAWMYAGGEPILHISEAKLPPDPSGVLDHLAFTASDLKATVARLKEHGIEFTLRQQVGTRIWQIFCNDPCGAKVELDFDPKETPPTGA